MNFPENQNDFIPLLKGLNLVILTLGLMASIVLLMVLF
jgi:hypothetical protein